MQAKRLEKESEILQERFVMLIGQVGAVLKSCVYLCVCVYMHIYVCMDV